VPGWRLLRDPQAASGSVVRPHSPRGNNPDDLTRQFWACTRLAPRLALPVFPRHFPAPARPPAVQAASLPKTLRVRVPCGPEGVFTALRRPRVGQHHDGFISRVSVVRSHPPLLTEAPSTTGLSRFPANSSSSRCPPACTLVEPELRMIGHERTGRHSQQTEPAAQPAGHPPPHGTHHTRRNCPLAGRPILPAQVGKKVGDHKASRIIPIWPVIMAVRDNQAWQGLGLVGLPRDTQSGNRGCNSRAFILDALS
jgi:hypothetical protein